MNTLVTDFDGTLTQYDFFELVRRRWPSPPGDDPWDDYVAGRVTHFEALAKIFGRIRTTESTLREIAAAMDLDPGAGKAAQTLKNHGWEVVVASAGCDWYIRQLLADFASSLEIHANPGTFEEGKGLLMTLPERSRFFSPETGVDKLAIVRDAIARSGKVAFAGDGRPDLEPALLVAPELRFARGWLAEELQRRGESFRPFQRWSEIAHQLLSQTC
ncbi:MtnX-like HAD-IB family phosphatase [soil metagenome]